MIARERSRYPAYEMVDLAKRRSLEWFAEVWTGMCLEEREMANASTRSFLRYMARAMKEIPDQGRSLDDD